MKTILVNVKIVMEREILDHGAVVFEDGVITGAGREADILAGKEVKGIGFDQLKENGGRNSFGQSAGVQILDGDGLYLSSGLIDLHLHGGNGYDFMDAEPEAFQMIADYHSRHGITSMLPTTLAGDESETTRILELFRIYAPRIDSCHLLGVHLEGPYFNIRQRGAQDPKYIKMPDREQMCRFLQTGCIRRVSMAPELPGAMELGTFLKERGVLVSAGHTEADYDTVKKASDCGYRLLTHLYSGMQGVHREGPFRRGGAVEAGLLLDRLAVELIADGCHLPSCLLNLVRRCKKKEDIILVTDAMRGAGLAEGTCTILGSRERGQKVIIEDSVAKMPDRTSFAGSVASGNRLIHVMHTMGGASLPEAIAMMTINPARLLGIADRKGRIAKGMDADMILFDESISIKAVWVSGRRIV